MYDAIIIGAGASGLFSAVLLSQTGKKILVLEQQALSGKKLALCGGGSCNLGPVERESEPLFHRYHRFVRHPKTGQLRQEPVRPLKTLYYAYPPELVRELWTSKETVIGPFKGLGISLREEEGRLYPAGYEARGLAAELTRRAEKNGVEFRYQTRVLSIEKSDGGYTVGTQPVSGEAEQSTAAARSVILASGGFSYPAVGGNDSGNALLSAFGIECRPGTPAMGPVTIRDYPFTGSSGTVIPARVTVRVRDGTAGAHSGSNSGAVRELVRSETDQLLFTHRGLSGPVILDICAAIHEAAADSPELELDLIPGKGREALLSQTQDLIREHPGKKTVQFLTPFFPRTLSAKLLEMAGIDPEAASEGIPKTSLSRMIDLVKSLNLSPAGNTARNEAMSWMGGCESAEIDFTTMEAKKAPGLFIIGDMVSFSRPCGGYSLWFCWTSALAAAVKAEKY